MYMFVCIYVGICMNMCLCLCMNMCTCVYNLAASTGILQRISVLLLVVSTEILQTDLGLLLVSIEIIQFVSVFFS